MANVKISQLPAASTITAGSDVLPIVHDGVTQKATPDQIVKKVLEAPGAIGGTTPSTGAFSAVNTGDLTTTGTVSLNGYITTDATAAFFDQPRIYDYADTHTYRLRGVSPGLAADVFCFLPVLGGNDTFVFQGHTQTLTNKTISGSSNTLSNIGNASLTNSSITINGTPVSLGGSISVGSGIPYPGAGIAVSTGTSWASSLTAPAGDLVGTTAVQDLSNKTLIFPTINGGNISGLSDLQATGNISLPHLVANSTALYLQNPRIYNPLLTNWYRITPSAITNDVYVTLPLLTTNDTFVFSDFAQTLTNKTISGSSNTLSNIGNASLTNSSITINGTAVSLGGSIVVGGGVSYPGAGIAVSTGSAWGTSKNVPSGDLVGTTDTQALSGKTLTSPTINGGTATSLTTLSVGTGGSVSFPFLNIDTTALFLRNPRIYDTLENNWYRITPSELTDNRYITLPALGGNDTFVFQNHTQTLTNKTLTTPVINGFTGDTSVVNIGSGQIYKDVSGNVGIGTSSPYAKATLYNASSNYQLLLKGGSAGVAGDGGGIAFSTAVLSAITSPDAAAAAIRSLNTFASESNGEQGDLAFYTNRRTGTNTYTGLTERLRINSSGGVAFTGSYGSAGQVLTSNGSSAAPTWGSAGSAIYFNVKDYGAVGNGTTDDTGAFNDAITAAKQSGTVGGTVFVPKGTYLITSTLSLLGVSLLGQGTSSIILGGSTASASNFISDANAPIIEFGGTVQLQNFYIKYNTTFHTGASIITGSETKGQRVLIRAANYSDAWQPIYGSKVENVIFDNCGTAFYNPARSQGTSTTSNTISTGSKSFTTTTPNINGSMNAGRLITIYGNGWVGSGLSMTGYVTSYSGTTLVVNVVSVTGSGTNTNWLILGPATSMFSTTLTTLVVWAYSYRGFDIRGNDRTGNIYQNIAITGGGRDYSGSADAGFALDSDTSITLVAAQGTESECTISQINVERATLRTAAFIFSQCSGLCANSIHIEDVLPNTSGFNYIYVTSSVCDIGAIDIINCNSSSFPANVSIFNLNSSNYQYSNSPLPTANYFGVQSLSTAWFGNNSTGISALSGFYIFKRGTNDGAMYVNLSNLEYGNGYGDSSTWAAFPVNGNLTILNNGYNVTTPAQYCPGKLTIGTNTPGVAMMTIGTDVSPTYTTTSAKAKYASDASKVWAIGPVVDDYLITQNNGSYLGVKLTWGATSWTTASDETIKTDLSPITNGLSKVNTLRAVTGKYIDDDSNTIRPFLLAQDVIQVLPEAVDNTEGQPLGVRYTEVIPLLVAAINELTARLEVLEAP